MKTFRNGGIWPVGNHYESNQESQGTSSARTFSLTTRRPNLLHGDIGLQEQYERLSYSHMT